MRSLDDGNIKGYSILVAQDFQVNFGARVHGHQAERNIGNAFRHAPIDGKQHVSNVYSSGHRGAIGQDIGNNWANFIAALRTRKHEDLNAPIEEGAISTTLVHLANIFVLADKAGLLRDAELAVDRMRPVMALAGVS